MRPESPSVTSIVSVCVARVVVLLLAAALAGAGCLALGTGDESANEERASDSLFYGLIVHGGTASYDADQGMLRVTFRHTRSAAGSAENWEKQLPRGAAAWPDRPLSPQEPTVLLQKMPYDDAVPVIQTLRDGGYWKFYCRNNGQGYFEVLKSYKVVPLVRID